MERFDFKRLLDIPEGSTLNFDKSGRAVLNFTNETDTSSSGMSDVQKTIVLADIISAAFEKSEFMDVVYQSDAGIKQKAKTVKIPYKTELDPTVSTTEATDRTWSELTNHSSVSFDYSLKKYGVKISKDLIATTGEVDILKSAREDLVNGLTQDIDSAIATALAAATPAATLYGGDATSTATLTAGDVLTPTLVNSARRYLSENKWRPEKDKPLVLFIAPDQAKALMDDPQFVNAAEYGSNEVVLNGEIGKYLGIKIVETTNVPSASTWGGGALDGHTCILCKAKVCGALVWFEKPNLDAEYDKPSAAHQVYLDAAYAVDSLHDNSIVLIKVLDA